MDQEHIGNVDSIPDSIDMWRSLRYKGGKFKLWRPLAPWLLEHGITLFKPGGLHGRLMVPDGVARGKEPTVYRLWEGTKDDPFLEDTQTYQRSPLIHPARDESGRWVMLRVLHFGTDRSQHQAVLEFLASYPGRADPRNHCLPMIQLVTSERMTVAAFPMMTGRDWDLPWFYAWDEGLNFVVQAAEGLVFMHENRIAHRDIAEENFVVNLAGPKQVQGQVIHRPWQIQFPIRYLYIDFEFAIQFSPKITGEQRQVEKYLPTSMGRDAAPEAVGMGRYDPFPADVFALGLVFWRMFRAVKEPGFMPLVERMLVSDPLSRPTADDVLCDFHSYRSSLTMHALQIPVDRPVFLNLKDLDETHSNAWSPRATREAEEGADV